MANDYYTPTDETRLTSARAEGQNTERAAVEAAFDKLPAAARFKERRINYALDTSSSTTDYTCTLSPAPVAYVKGMRIDLEVNNANTGAATLNVNGLGAKTILYSDGTAIDPAALITQRINPLIYDGTAFRLAFDGTSTAPAPHAHPISEVTGLQSALDAKAPLASPTLTGTPAAPTASPGTDTTQIATTAFVKAAVDTGIADIGAIVTLIGVWDASSGSFPGSGSAEAGHSWIVSVGGTVDSVEFVAGDRIVAITDSASTSTYSGNWHHLDYTDKFTEIVQDTTPQLGGALDGQGHDLNNLGVVFLTEQAAAEADVAGKGQLWVKTATPNQLWFTDDAGTDRQLQTPRGYIYGLTLSNNSTDATNDIDIAAGQCASDDDDPVLITLSSGITKRLDAAWAVGDGNGGLDTGSIADGTYHEWVIRRSDTGVVDALLSASATSPVMPTNYDQKRRVGSIIRASGAIRTFKQAGDIFSWDTPTTEHSSTTSRASALLAVTVPTGIKCHPILSALLSGNTSNGTQGLGSAAAGTDTLRVNSIADTSFGSNSLVIPPIFETNTSAQIYYSTTLDVNVLVCELYCGGWIDRRGKDA